MKYRQRATRGDIGRRHPMAFFERMLEPGSGFDRFMNMLVRIVVPFAIAWMLLGFVPR